MHVYGHALKDHRVPALAFIVRLWLGGIWPVRVGVYWIALITAWRPPSAIFDLFLSRRRSETRLLFGLQTVSSPIRNGLVLIVSTKVHYGCFAKAVRLQVLSMPPRLGYAKVIIVVVSISPVAGIWTLYECDTARNKTASLINSSMRDTTQENSRVE
jgi:hypothetical protein